MTKVSLTGCEIKKEPALGIQARSMRDTGKDVGDILFLY